MKATIKIQPAISEHIKSPTFTIILEGKPIEIKEYWQEIIAPIIHPPINYISDSLD